MLALTFGLVALCGASLAQDLIVKHADVPRYPGLAVEARLSGTLTFRVSVDHGSVSSVEPNPSNSPTLRMLQDAAVTNIRSWSFYGGERTTFDVEFSFELSQEEVPVPENPHIEMTLPRFVRLVAHPVKPTVSDGEKQ
jgi:outer membrane biosynthesis protein TonB